MSDSTRDIREKLSRDYEKLYSKICAGQEALGFVDYSFRGVPGVCRDAAGIRKRGEGSIAIGCRGIEYGRIYPFELEDGKHTERELFIQRCEGLNLEWADTDLGEFILQPGHVAVSRDFLQTVHELVKLTRGETNEALTEKRMRSLSRWLQGILSSPAADQPKPSCPEFPDNSTGGPDLEARHLSYDTEIYLSEYLELLREEYDKNGESETGFFLDRIQQVEQCIAAHEKIAGLPGSDPIVRTKDGYIGGDPEEILPLVIHDMKQRGEMGMKKYGRPLTANNGRDALRDAYEEAMDLCQYLRQAIEERGSDPAREGGGNG